MHALKVKILVAAFAVVGVWAVHAEVTLVVGEQIPNFSAKDIAGKTHSIFDHLGYFVVLEWVNHDCPYVKKFYDAGEMQRLQKTYTDRGVVWLTVGSSKPESPGYYTPEEAARISQEQGAHYTTYLYDADGTVARRYGAKTTPHMYVINPAGTLLYQGALDSIASVDPNDIARAENYVVSALAEAMDDEEVTTDTTRPYGSKINPID